MIGKDGIQLQKRERETHPKYKYIIITPPPLQKNLYKCPTYLIFDSSNSPPPLVTNHN